MKTSWRKNPEKIKFFRELLNKKLDALAIEGDKTVDVMRELKEEFPDPTDRALLESNRNFDLRIKEREMKLIGKVKAALAKLDSETYGICEECGKDISEKRLKARPVASLCIECKTRQEQREKQIRRI